MNYQQPYDNASFGFEAYQTASGYPDIAVDHAAGPAKRASDSSASAGGNGESEQPKKKRKQYQACDACRLRRVRCERDEGAGEDEPCRGCKRRGFACTKEYNAARSQESRSGKLLNQARALFGGNDRPAGLVASAPPSRALSLQPDDIIPLISDSSSEEPPLFAYDSAEGRLGQIQAREFVMNDLVQCYRENLLSRNPIMEDFDGFLDRFEQSGRRLEALQVNDRALSALVLALASRVTDLPVIAGPNSPKISLFLNGAVDPNADFATFGETREAICRALETRARSCVEQRFMGRIVSVESITALMAMQGIEDVDDPDTALTKSRPYSAAAIEQLRALVRKDKKTQREMYALKGPLMKDVLVTDSMWGLPTGRTLQVSDEDLAVFHPDAFRYTPMEVAQMAYTINDDQYLWLLVDQMFMLARTIRKETTSPLAKLRNATPRASFYLECGRDLTAMMEVCEAYKSRGRTGDTLWQQSLRACEFGFGIELAWLHWQCEQTMRKTAEPVRSELNHALAVLYPQMQSALEALADSSKYLYDNGMLLGNNLLWSSMAEAADILLKLPSDVEGGPPTFTLQRKVECVENMLCCIRQLAYSWPSSVRALPDLEHQASVLKARLYLETGMNMHDNATRFAEQPYAPRSSAAPTETPWLFTSVDDLAAQHQSGSSGSSSAHTPASDTVASSMAGPPTEGPPLTVDDRFWQSLFNQ